MNRFNASLCNIFGVFFVGAFALSGPLLEAKEKEQPTVQDHHSSLQHALQKKEYKLVIEAGKAILAIAPQSPFAAETTYTIGVAYFNLNDFDLANTYFSTFLEKYATPEFFEQAVEYKYKIAEEFETGSGRHMFGVESLPKWVSAWDDAFALYEEIIKTLPNHEVAARAMFRKAVMQYTEKKTKEALDTYRTITRRFPKHPLAPESYLAIAKIYHDHSLNDYPDKDFLEQARLNVKRFRKDFPSEERLIVAQSLLVEMQDAFAKDLWVSAQYYEKKKNLDAARLYLEKIARLYPESSYAKDAIAKLTILDGEMTTVKQNVEEELENVKDVNDQKFEM